MQLFNFFTKRGDVMKKFFSIVLSFSLLLCCTSSWADVPGFMKEQMGTLKGTVYVKDKVYAKAIVSFFDKTNGPPPVVGSARRVPDAVDRSNAQGEFSLKLLPGTYYMGVMFREPSKGMGPPRSGEEYFFIESEPGSLREFTVETKKSTEAGRVNGSPPGAFHEFKNFITISGKITGEDGKPLAGALVTLKTSMDAPRPRYISGGSAADGTFSIKVPPGKYFAVGRESVEGGKPGIGASIGSYGKTAPLGDSGTPPNVGSQSGASPAARGLQGAGEGQAIAIEGKDGDVIENINIQMFKIPNPVETRAKFEAEAQGGTGEKPVPPAGKPEQAKKE
jgi:hypothetical protein